MHIWYQKMSKHVKLQIVLEEHNLLPSKLMINMKFDFSLLISQVSDLQFSFARLHM
jgi:hypothetical protein